MLVPPSPTWSVENGAPRGRVERHSGWRAAGTETPYRAAPPFEASAIGVDRATPEDQPHELGTVGRNGEPGPLAALFPGDEPRRRQHREVMADGGLAAIERLVEVTGAHLSPGIRGDQAEQPEPHRIGERLESGGPIAGDVDRDRFVGDRGATPWFHEPRLHILTAVDVTATFRPTSI